MEFQCQRTAAVHMKRAVYLNEAGIIRLVVRVPTFHDKGWSSLHSQHLGSHGRNGRSDIPVIFTLHIRQNFRAAGQVDQADVEQAAAVIPFQRRLQFCKRIADHWIICRADAGGTGNGSFGIGQSLQRHTSR